LKRPLTIKNQKKINKYPDKMVVVNGNILITQMLQFQITAGEIILVLMVGGIMAVEITQMNNIKFLHQIHIVL
jgi:hypothetical protein